MGNDAAWRDRVALYDRLIGTRADLERKGASMPYTSVNGHMFSFLTPEGRLALRLPEGLRTSFLERYQSHLCVQHGRVMKEYVEVPDALLEATEALEPYFRESFAYVASLKPKPTTKSAKSGG